MSDTNTLDGGAEDTRGTTLASVQPREVTESAFRALCAAGADPSEAQEGALAVLRAEVDAHGGLVLLEDLLEACWAQPMLPAGTRSTSWAGITVHELDCPEQPALRTAIQLMDLASCGNTTEARVARTAVAGLPRTLWNDLLLRRSASLRRTIIAALPTTADTEAGATEYLTVQDGAVTSSTEPPNEATAASVLRTPGGNGTVIIVLPGSTNPIQLDVRVCQKPLKVREEEWLRMYQLARNYLMADQ